MDFRRWLDTNAGSVENTIYCVAGHGIKYAGLLAGLKSILSPRDGMDYDPAAALLGLAAYAAGAAIAQRAARR